MSITREAFWDLVERYGNGDTNKIEMVVTTNSDVIKLSWYRRKGFGYQWVDVPLGDGNYRTGIELYGPIPHSAESSLNNNYEKAITFIDIGMIDRISFIATQPPDWAWKDPNDNDT